MMKPVFLAGLGLLVAAAAATAADANRLAYLDQLDPYYPGRNFPKLATPQWVGEAGVEAVVILSIDDMVGPERWEQFLRPLLDRLKQVDGRAPVSIMTNRVDPRHPQLAAWLREGLSLEVHTTDHPCPLLQGGDFARAQRSYAGCVDSMFAIPGNRPVAFRMPCCDSLNTLSPRFFVELFDRTTPGGKFLAIDSSVFNLLTSDDPELPRELLVEADGRDRFRKYVPFPSFANTIENYPYPYVVGHLCWEFPCVVPSDWSAQNLHQPNNPRTVADLQVALDLVVRKQGVYTLVFHPHNWIRAEQLVALVDYAVARHGRKVKFLTFAEALDRLEKNLLDGGSLRDDRGLDAGVRIVDLNGDGHVDVVRDDGQAWHSKTWDPQAGAWRAQPPLRLLPPGRHAPLAAARWGVVHEHGGAAVLYADGQHHGAAVFAADRWQPDPRLQAALDAPGAASELATRRDGQDGGVRLIDLDQDGRCELILGGAEPAAVLRYLPADRVWQRLPWTLPQGAAVVTPAGGDAGLRWVDVDEDGALDLLFSHSQRYGLYLFDSIKSGWSRRAVSGVAGEQREIPPLVRADGSNNGAWFHSRHLWLQNEDTARLADLVDRRSFGQLLKGVEPRALEPPAALRSLRARPGFQVELMAAEPLTMDPVAMAWGPDAKLWIAEMADYPLGIDGRPGGRVRYLEDTDGDGRYDRSTLFLEGLAYPTGVAPWRGGVLVTAAPDILYAEDADGDGRAERREVLFTGLGEGNQQHRANGLQWGLDGWLHCANGDSGGTVRSLRSGQSVSISGRDFRIRPDQGLVDPQTGQAQFGRHRDDWDNWFGSNNANPMYHYVLADHYLRRNVHLAPRGVREDVSEAPGVAPVFPRSRTLARFNDLHTANRFTSACSAIVYRDELLGPEFSASTFVCEPVHNLVHREVLTARGLSFRSRRGPDEQTSEFLASSDNWFRPVMVQTGPDGALWIVDMYRQVIEHPEWIPTDWQARLDLRAGHERGRIYRVWPVGVPPRPIVRLDRLELPALVAAMDSPNGPQRDLVQQMLLWRADAAAAPLLAELVRRSLRPQCRAQAVATLAGLGHLNEGLLLETMGDAHPGVRREAIRHSEPLLAEHPALGAAILALEDDPDLNVQLQRAYALGAWRDPRAGAALGRAAARWSGEPALMTGILSSAHGENIELLLAAVLEAGGATGPPAGLVEQLAAMASALGQPRAMTGLVARLTESADGRYAAWQMAGLAGVLDSAARRRVDWNELAKTHRGLPRLVEQARRLASNAAAGESERLAAIRLLGRWPGERRQDLAILAELLAPQSGAMLQSAAVAALARVDEPAAAAALAAPWRGLSPRLRSEVLAALLSRGTGIEALLAALEQRQIAAADLDVAARGRLLQLRNAELRARAERLLAGAIDPQRQQVVDSHRRVLEQSGDAQAGERVFLKRCAACHRLGDKGHPVGPDLAALTDNSPLALLVAILDPNRAVEAKFIEYLATTQDGRVLSGLLADETGASITLRAQEGQEHVLLRNELESLAASGRSLMPEGMEQDLPPQDLADLIAFLRSTGSPRKQFPLSNPTVVQADTDGTLTLSATDCEIFGTTLVLEDQYRNLGYWSSENDRAVWTADVPREGVYLVRMDFACADASSGNRFVLSAGSQQLEVQVPGTGSWDDYRQLDVGRVTLRGGRQQLAIRSAGPVRGAVVDLKNLTLRPVR